MKVLIGLLLGFAAFSAVLLGAAVGLGWCLHWLFPGVDLGMAILIGLVTQVTAILALVQFVRSAMMLHEWRNEKEEDEEEEEEEELPIPPPAFHHSRRKRPNRR